jgi:hypothetical protein
MNSSLPGDDERVRRSEVFLSDTGALLDTLATT